jgi:Lrp/AsnC family leucine-responsive transcriptional regulator
VERVVLDAVDRRILSELARNGRATYADLGRAVSLSPHAVADRVRRLIEARIITGFGASVDFGAIGRGLDALVDVRLLPATSPDHFEGYAAALPAVREVSFVTGRFDYQLRLACEDADDLDRTVRALRQGAGAAVTETRIVLRTQACLPELGAPSMNAAAKT